MSAAPPTRRTILKMAGISVPASLFAPRTLGRAEPRIVVIGGGFGGATCARELRRRGLSVSLVEPKASYVSCPFSNSVIAGLRDITAQSFTYDGLQRQGVRVIQQAAAAVDAHARQVTLGDRTVLSYDRLVLAPGIEVRFDATEGYDEAAAQVMPHAWNAGAQTQLLKRQLETMNDGGVVVIAVPANPFRCPPGPYERASLVAYYLRRAKPRSKVLILDAKDSFSKQRLFEEGWRQLYPGLIEWIPLSAGGRVTRVNASEKTLATDFGQHRADVANVIPAQRAGKIAQVAGITDATGWCPIDPVTFESKLRPYIHVVGDATIAGAMPKSGFSANDQAKVCALAIRSVVSGEDPPAPKLVNTCYSLVAPDFGISISGVYEPAGGVLQNVEGAGGASPIEGPRSFRSLEAAYAHSWFQTITANIFG